MTMSPQDGQRHEGALCHMPFFILPKQMLPNDGRIYVINKQVGPIVN